MGDAVISPAVKIGILISLSRSAIFSDLVKVDGIGRLTKHICCKGRNIDTNDMVCV